MISMKDQETSRNFIKVCKFNITHYHHIIIVKCDFYLFLSGAMQLLTFFCEPYRYYRYIIHTYYI